MQQLFPFLVGSVDPNLSKTGPYLQNTVTHIYFCQSVQKWS